MVRQDVTLRRPPFRTVPSAGSDMRKRPDGPFIVTASDVQSYLRCRRNWDYTSANRQSLFKKGMPTPALHIGAAVHYALAMHWRGENWLVALNRHYEATKAQLEKDYREAVGTGMSYQELDLLSEHRMECQFLLQAYFARYGEDNPTKPYKIVASEITFMIPLDEWLDIWLMGTIDRICVDKYGSVIPLEIKTYKTAPKRENWAFNFQTHVYALALQKLLGIEVGMALYDGIRKKGPTEPQLLKTKRDGSPGGVSRKWIDTTYERYLTVVKSVHGGDVPIQYAEILSRLHARDKSPTNAFVHRFRISLLESALEQTWDVLRVAAREMAYSPLIIPSKDWQGCPMCRTKDLCDAQYAGEPLDVLIERGYRSDTSPTRKATHIATRENVKTLDDLIAFAKDAPHDPLSRHKIGSLEE